MRNLLTMILIFFTAVASLGQEAIYWPEHEGMTRARWSPDGKFIATWGEGPLARIWRDHDGSLALEIDHSELEWVLPGGEALSRPKLRGLRMVFWSLDGQYIMTQAIVADKLIFQHAWDVNTHEEVYSHLWGRVEHFVWDIEKLHELVGKATLVASWYRNSMSFLNTDSASSTFGQTVANIDFGELVTWETGSWNKTKDEALLRLHTSWHTGWRRPCDACEMYFTLIDADLKSSTFGEILWRSEAVQEASAHIWPNGRGLLVVSRIDSVEVWDLNRESEGFGMRLARLEFGEARHYDILYDEKNQRLIVVRLAIVEQHRESYLDWERCVVNACEFVAAVFDIDIESVAFGQRLLEIRHPYRLKEEKSEGGYSDLNRVRLNQSATQAHFYTLRSILSSGVVRLNDEVAAYDLVTGDPVDARHRLPAAAFYRERNGVVEKPPAGMELGFDREWWYWDALAVNPAGNKIMFRLVSNDARADDYWLMQNLETGEYFFPPDTWSDTVFQG